MILLVLSVVLTLSCGMMKKELTPEVCNVVLQTATCSYLGEGEYIVQQFGILSEVKTVRFSRFFHPSTLTVNKFEIPNLEKIVIDYGSVQCKDIDAEAKIFIDGRLCVSVKK